MKKAVIFLQINPWLASGYEEIVWEIVRHIEKHTHLKVDNNAFCNYNVHDTQHFDPAASVNREVTSATNDGIKQKTHLLNDEEPRFTKKDQCSGKNHIEKSRGLFFEILNEQTDENASLQTNATSVPGDIAPSMNSDMTCDATQHNNIRLDEYQAQNKTLISSDNQCGMCKKVLRSRSGLMRHMVIHSDDNKQMTCNICPFVASSKRSLTMHITGHKEKLMCQKCGKTYTSKGAFSNHKEKCHKSKDIPPLAQIGDTISLDSIDGSGGCDTNFIKESEESVSTKSNDDCCGFDVDKIGGNVALEDEKDSLLLHTSDHFHEHDTCDDTKFEPDNCSLKLTNKYEDTGDVIKQFTELENCLQLISSEPFNLCGNSDVQYEHHTPLKSTNTYFEQMSNVSSQELIHRCMLCKKCCKTPNELSSHMNTHKMRQFRSNLSKKSFGKALLHKRRLADKETCSSKLSGKSFGTISWYKKQMSLHVGEGPYECETCGLKFILKATMKAHHRKVHAPKKPILDCKCLVCSQHFTTVSALHYHRRVSTHYQCPLCMECSNTASNLLLHLKAHQVNKFPCNLCSKSFDNAMTLMNHMKRHTGEKLHVCTVCGESFVVLTTYKRHIAYHSDVTPI